MRGREGERECLLSARSRFGGGGDWLGWVGWIGLGDEKKGAGMGVIECILC